MLVERAYLRRVKPKPKRFKLARLSVPTTAPALSRILSKPIKFSVNIIVPATADRLAYFVSAGTASPYRSLDEIPEAVRGFVVQSSDELDPEPDDSPQSLNYTTNMLYSVDDRGHRRTVRREIVNLERMRAEQEAIEQSLNAEPDEQLAAAMQVVPGGP
jgi:hypothetical protein